MGPKPTPQRWVPPSRGRWGGGRWLGWLPLPRGPEAARTAHRRRPPRRGSAPLPSAATLRNPSGRVGGARRKPGPTGNPRNPVGRGGAASLPPPHFAGSSVCLPGLRQPFQCYGAGRGGFWHCCTAVGNTPCELVLVCKVNHVSLALTGTTQPATQEKGKCPLSSVKGVTAK